MYKIAFFCIPAHGHTNPTIEVVRELTHRGCEVWYYSYEPFHKQIEDAGAKFIPCDPYELPTQPVPEDSARVGLDIAFSIRLLTDTTLALDEMVCRSLTEFQPNCVIADSMAVWGKFAALKLGIPFISSTTTFAFNRYSSKIMNQDFSQVLSLLKALPSVHRDIKRLRAHGYPVKNLLSILQNDNDTNTIVYTSKEFQPAADTFSNQYLFVGPSVSLPDITLSKPQQQTVYISMGTVNNRMPNFYRNCIQAFEKSNLQVIISVGEGTDLSALGNIPSNFIVKNRVNQMEVLQTANVFLSHCGMNSVSESLFCCVPLVLFPQTPEQSGVANRVLQLQAGVLLKEDSPDSIRSAVECILSDHHYHENAAKISESFHRAGGAATAADGILKIINAHSPFLYRPCEK